MVGFLSIFLLLCDQATWKGRFEELQGKKSNPSFPLCDFDLGEKALTWVKGVFIDSNPLLELFKLDSMVGYYKHEFRGSYLSFCGREMTKSIISGQNPRVVPVPNIGGTGTHCTEGIWYRFQKLVVPVPIHQ